MESGVGNRDRDWSYRWERFPLYRLTSRERRALQLYAGVARVYRALSATLFREARDPADPDVKVTPAEFRLLERLLHPGSLTHRELAAEVFVSPGHLSHLVNSLETKGLVYRELVWHDRRTRKVELTLRGRAFMSRVYPRYLGRLVELAGVLPSFEQARVAKNCYRLIEACPKQFDHLLCLHEILERMDPAPEESAGDGRRRRRPSGPGFGAVPPVG